MNTLNLQMEYISSVKTTYLTAPFLFCSPFYELFVVLDDSLVCGIENFKMTKNEVFMISPQQKIELTPEESCVLIQISFNPEALICNRAYALFECPFKIPNNEDLLPLSIETARQMIKSNISEYQLASKYLLFLELLLNVIPTDANQLATPSLSITAKQKKLLDSVLIYMEKNYDKNISLTDTASVFNITPQYLSSFFKNCTGNTFQGYLNKLRLKIADLYLSYTNLNIEDITLLTGSKNVTLSDDLLLQKQNIESSYSYGLPILSNDTALKYLDSFYSKESLENTKIVPEIVTIDNNSEKAMFDFWRKLINIGYATDFTNAKIFDQIKQMQKEIGFCYGRICRIFDLLTDYVIDNKTIHDYNRIFRILDTLHENNLIPFIELSNKLFRIQLSSSDAIPMNHLKDSSEYFKTLLKLLPSFLCASINRYGYDSVSKWHFEIGYLGYEFIEEPEIFPFTKYAYYFGKIKNCIKEYLPTCKVGGPGFNDWKSPNSILNLFKVFDSYQTFPDFLTAYVYPLTSNMPDAIISNNENLLLERITELRTLIDTKSPNIDFWITEFNSNLSSRNLINDSSFQSSFLIRNILKTSKINLSAMGYYMMSDVSLRYADTIDMLFGGWGLFSDKSLKKPSYYAYSLLSRLGDSLIAIGNRYVITRSGNNYQCLFYHHEHLTDELCKRNVLADDFLIPDSMFINKNADHYILQLNSSTLENYIIKKYTISHESGNLLNEWFKIGCSTPFHEDDYRLLDAVSEMRPEISLEKTDADTPLKISISLKQQDVILVIIDSINAPLTQIPEGN